MSEVIYTLRPLEENDLDLFYELYNDKFILENAVTINAFPQTLNIVRERLMRWMNSDSDKFFCILSNNKEPIGIAQLYNVESSNRKCTLGILIKEEFTNKGIGTLVCKELIEIAFNYMNLRKIEVRIVETNTLSLRMIEKLSFQKEGVLKESYFHGGKYYDLHLYGLIKD